MVNCFRQFQFVSRKAVLRQAGTVGTRARLGPAGKLRPIARFAGNELLSPAQHSVVLHVR